VVPLPSFQLRMMRFTEMPGAGHLNGQLFNCWISFDEELM
jgi:hypothetical protein